MDLDGRHGDWIASSFRIAAGVASWPLRALIGSVDIHVEPITDTSQNHIRKGTTSFQRPMPPQGDVNMSAIIMPKTSSAIKLFDISHNALHQTNKTTTNPAEALTNGC
jgi:hypothetical protein